MTPVIEIKGLSKRYNVGGSIHHDTLRDTLAGYYGKMLGREKQAHEAEFWALRDVTFSVQPGEVIGVIGRNGAGKSTLLKILSRITPPSEGEIIMRGRLASLLEVGTGFHQELSGRENIFLNGAILGMTRREIKAKFDEIVAFAEVERFIDTPVKRYSSGMYVRLAFAVAAHLDPEILVIDEVLAVGDLQFQKKCLGRMSEISKGGRTVLFVSHNMESIENLCDKTILLDSGRLLAQGPTSETINYYINNVLPSVTAVSLAEREDRKGTGEYRYTKVWLTNAVGETVPHALPGQPITINLEVLPQAGASQRPVDALANVVVNDLRGNRIFTLSNHLLGQPLVLDGPCVISYTLADVQLYEGEYRCKLNLARSTSFESLDWIQDAFVLSVAAGDYFKTGKTAKSEHDIFFVNHRVAVREGAR